MPKPKYNLKEFPGTVYPVGKDRFYYQVLLGKVKNMQPFFFFVSGNSYKQNTIIVFQNLN